MDIRMNMSGQQISKISLSIKKSVNLKFFPVEVLEADKIICDVSESS